MFDDYDDLEPPKPNNRPRYDYKGDCGHMVERDFREASFVARCEECEETRLFKRVYSMPYAQPIMHEHFNNAVGKPISDMRKFKNELSRQSDQQSEESGYAIKYAPVEYGDHAAVGATGEGIYESNVKRSRDGNPLLPEIKGEV